MKASIGIILSIIFSLAIFTPSSLAHGSLEPKHGGIVKEAHDMVFELVRKDNSVIIYVTDHGEDYSTAKLTGNIIVLSSGKKVDKSLTPAGGNKMTAEVLISDGAKVLIKVKDGEHHPVTIRYSF